MRRILSRGLLLVLATVCLLLPQPATAQESDALPILWISYVTAEPGKSTELGMHMASEGAPLYDGLLADGHVVSWGVAQAVNHYPGDDWSHLEFVNFRDWAGVGEFVKRFMAGMGEKSAEERAEDAAKWAELRVHGSHYDLIGRHGHLAVGGGRPGYIMLATFKTAGVGGNDPAELYRKWRAPVMDGLLEAGTINAHGFYNRVMHGPEGWEDITAWYTMPELGAVDAVQAAVMAAQAARSEEQSAEWMADMQKTIEAPAEGNHTDRLLVVLHYNSAALGE